jgi:hypothetical protein
MLGFSQVTTIVESQTHTPVKGSQYQILFGATLVEPYYVTLVDPVEIPKRVWAEANELWTTKTCNRDDWELWLRLQYPGFKKVNSVTNNWTDSFRCFGQDLAQTQYDCI